eukprot:3739696-Alexandrium_andersonii.AAC.1
MLIANGIWDVRTVQCGLMNGARGVVVAVVCDQTPPALPSYVVVDFPGYRGHAIWPAHPTWVPVPPIR